MNRPPFTILAVDDSEMELMVMAKVLRDFTCVTESVPERALALAQTKKFDLVLLDVNMPGMSGLELGRLIKEIPLQETTSMMFLSGEDTLEKVIACLNTGAVDFIRKPFVAEELRARIATQLRLLEAQRNLVALRELDAVKKLLVTLNHVFNNKLSIVLAGIQLTLRDCEGKPERLRLAEQACRDMAEVLQKLNALEGVEGERYSDSVDMLKVDFEKMT